MLSEGVLFRGKIDWLECGRYTVSWPSVRLSASRPGGCEFNSQLGQTKDQMVLTAIWQETMQVGNILRLPEDPPGI